MSGPKCRDPIGGTQMSADPNFWTQMSGTQMSGTQLSGTHLAGPKNWDPNVRTQISGPKCPRARATPFSLATFYLVNGKLDENLIL